MGLSVSGGTPPPLQGGRVWETDTQGVALG
jgi:hypothetical protein